MVVNCRLQPTACGAGRPGDALCGRDQGHTGMSAWRRRALAIFPDLRSQLQSEERDLFSLFNELEDMAEHAHSSGDAETLVEFMALPNGASVKEVTSGCKRE